MATTYRVPGAVLTERAHSVPLDHSKPDGEKITVFTRELAAPAGLDRPSHRLGARYGLTPTRAGS